MANRESMAKNPPSRPNGGGGGVTGGHRSPAYSWAPPPQTDHGRTCPPAYSWAPQRKLLVYKMGCPVEDALTFLDKYNLQNYRDNVDDEFYSSKKRVVQR
jgi:hypothetical protein